MGPKELYAIKTNLSIPYACFVVNFAEGREEKGEAQLPRENKSVEVVSCGSFF
jgi:hypothetical protein